MLFQGVLLIYTPLPSSCSLGGSCFPSGGALGAVPPQCSPSLPTAEQTVAPVAHLWLCPRAGSALGSGTRPCAVPSPGNGGRINPSPEGSPCSLNGNCKCLLTPDWECSECPETEFLQHCAESKMQREIIRYVGRGEKHSTLLELLFSVT